LKTGLLKSEFPIDQSLALLLWSSLSLFERTKITKRTSGPKGGFFLFELCLFFFHLHWTHTPSFSFAFSLCFSLTSSSYFGESGVLSLLQLDKIESILVVGVDGGRNFRGLVHVGNVCVDELNEIGEVLNDDLFFFF
jgi:hypothetical protein